MGLYKILRIAAMVLGLIGVVMLIVVLSSETECNFADEVLQAECIKRVSGVISPYLIIAYITLGLAILFTLLFTVTNLLSNPQALKKALISLGLFAAVVLITYFTSTGEAVEKQGVQIVSENGSRWVGAGLRTFYVLTVVAIGLMVYSGVRKLIKN